MSAVQHYGDKDGLLVLSRNAILSIIVSNRNYGKTWAFKKRAFRRGIKRQKRTLWLRIFKAEMKEAAAKMYTSRDLQKYCGISVYSEKQNPNGNFKQEGYKCFCRKSPTHPWFCFLELGRVGDPDALRSADDVDLDTIVVDEFAKTISKMRRYRGRIVDDFLDIFFSCKREHQVRLILLGNKESVSNPFYAYFGIKPPAADWQGIRSYRKGAIVLQQINNVSVAKTDYDKKLNCLLAGTPYGKYISDGQYKGISPFRKRRMPADASLYVQLCIEGSAVKISCADDRYYVNQSVDASKLIYCDRLYAKYAHEKQLVKRYKKYFAGYIEALADNRISYDSEAAFEAVQRFNQWLMP